MGFFDRDVFDFNGDGKTDSFEAEVELQMIPDPEIVNGREKRIVPKQETILTITKVFDTFVSKWNIRHVTGLCKTLVSLRIVRWYR